MQPRTLANFINGEFVEPSTNAYIDDVNPATNIIVARVPRSNEDDVNKATAAAKAAFPACGDCARVRYRGRGCGYAQLSRLWACGFRVDTRSCTCTPGVSQHADGHGLGQLLATQRSAGSVWGGQE
eukprot:Colp12_sorted_trinity150504_noHs@18155